MIDVTIAVGFLLLLFGSDGFGAALNASFSNGPEAKLLWTATGVLAAPGLVLMAPAVLL